MCCHDEAWGGDYLITTCDTISDSGDMKSHLRFEHRREQLLPRRAFFIRLAVFVCLAIVTAMVSLGIGIIGYHRLEGLSWVDATLNAAMILGGMGPVNELHNSASKLFASAYALFSGLVIIAVMGLFLAPIVHRLMHRFHVEAESKESSEE